MFLDQAGDLLHLKDIPLSFLKACEGFVFLGFMRFMGYAVFIFWRQALSLVSYVTHISVNLGS